MIRKVMAVADMILYVPVALLGVMLGGMLTGASSQPPSADYNRDST
ncbi:hypothetical protein NZK35_28260 [Stieleria sp. ICT_E10.1]|nr:hypothetical protein [Stieleria sedimenti]MCS7470564.1 hypothetical protein [Stieleria sedimenti]